MDIIIWDRVIIAIVAVYGAIMSTITFISRSKEKQSQLKVEISNGLIGTAGAGVSEVMLFIEIYNSGYRDVTINVPKIILPNRKIVVFPNPLSDVTFPHRLKEGSSCKVWTELKDLAQNLSEHGYTGIIKINADVYDGAGRRHKSSKPWKLDIDEWTSK